MFNVHWLTVADIGLTGINGLLRSAIAWQDEATRQKNGFALSGNSSESVNRVIIQSRGLTHRP